MKRSRLLHALAVSSLAVTLAAPIGARSASTVSAPHWRQISTKAPAWYTEAMKQKVVAAGVKGYRVPNSITMPAAASLAFLGIRPGQLILVDNGDGTTSLCTSNFVFRNGSNFAIGTAGHCGNVGNQVTMLTLPRVLVDIGTITKSTGNAGPGKDFALISIKPELNSLVSPSMAFWGGPKAVYPGTKTPSVIKHIGWGLVIGTGGTPRVGVGVSYSTAGEFRFEGVITPGDSGSGAEAGDGTAVGAITHIVLDFPRRSPYVWMAGTSMQKILQIAGLPLATCATIPWPLKGCPKP